MPQQLKKVLGQSPELTPLLANAKALSVLQQEFVSVTPPHLAQSCQVLSFREGILNVAVANAVLAAKLRQLAPDLANLMHNRGYEINGIRFRVQVSYDRPLPPKVQRRIGNSAKIALIELSRKLRESPLKQALEKLAGRK